MMEGYEGEVFFTVNMTVKNLQKEDADPFDRWDDTPIKLELDYDNGYRYDGSAYDNSSGLGSSFIDLNPLEANSNICYSFFCPKEVMDNTDAPLFLIINAEGTKYKLVVR